MKQLTITHLTKRYGPLTALDDVTLTLEDGHIYGLLGRNGAGKTTLLNIVTGKYFADGGEVLLDGKPVLENDWALANIHGMTAQNFFPGFLRVREALKNLQCFYPAFTPDYARGLLEKFELRENAKLSQLSTGYQSIFKLIVALSVHTEVTLFDEPVLGLDANHRDLFYRELLANFAEDPRLFLISTHLIAEAAGLIDQTILLEQGKVLLTGETEELLRRGYSVSGPAAQVDAYCAGRRVLGVEALGGLKTACLLGEPGQLPDSLELGRLDLQALFIQLTNQKGA